MGELAAAAAARDAALVVGAEVITADQQTLGAIEEIDGDNIVVTSNGIPDYTYIETLDASGLAWECLRRNPEYCAQYPLMRDGLLSPAAWGLRFPG